MNRLRQFWDYAAKVFDLPGQLRRLPDPRPEAFIPTRALSASLFLGAVLRVPSLLQLQAETVRQGWQGVVGWKGRISDDTFGHGLERYDVAAVRAVLAHLNQTLKRNKAFEPAKIGGWLAVALDANEQFKSRARCCDACCQRQIEIKDQAGQSQPVTEYYHRQVYAQIHGPVFSAILDLEPIRPGEDEAAAAVRLLERLRELYGPRFFDVVTVDAWYATGPFVKAVQRLGWGVVAVLKQARYEIDQEATTLSAAQKPERFEWNNRQVALTEVKDLPFTDPEVGLMRVVLADETWNARQQVGGQTVVVPRQSHWRWLADRTLDGAPARVVHGLGHQRWGVENHAFNELTQYYHLTHCPRHEGA